MPALGRGQPSDVPTLHCTKELFGFSRAPPMSVALASTSSSTPSSSLTREQLHSAVHAHATSLGDKYGAALKGWLSALVDGDKPVAVPRCDVRNFSESSSERTRRLSAHADAKLLHANYHAAWKVSFSPAIRLTLRIDLCIGAVCIDVSCL